MLRRGPRQHRESSLVLRASSQRKAAPTVTHRQVQDGNTGTRRRDRQAYANPSTLNPNTTSSTINSRL